MENGKFQVVIDHLVRVSQEFVEIKLNQQQLSERLMRIENDHGHKINALFDGWQVQQGVNNSVLSKLTSIEDKLDNFSVKVAHHELLLEKNFG